MTDAKAKATAPKVPGRGPTSPLVEVRAANGICGGGFTYETPEVGYRIEAGKTGKIPKASADIHIANGDCIAVDKG